MEKMSYLAYRKMQLTSWKQGRCDWATQFTIKYCRRRSGWFGWILGWKNRRWWWWQRGKKVTLGWRLRCWERVRAYINHFRRVWSRRRRSSLQFLGIMMAISQVLQRAGVFDQTSWWTNGWKQWSGGSRISLKRIAETASLIMCSAIRDGCNLSLPLVMIMIFQILHENLVHNEPHNKLWNHKFPLKLSELGGLLLHLWWLCQPFAWIDDKILNNSMWAPQEKASKSLPNTRTC